MSRLPYGPGLLCLCLCLNLCLVFLIFLVRLFARVRRNPFHLFTGATGHHASLLRTRYNHDSTNTRVEKPMPQIKYSTLSTYIYTHIPISRLVLILIIDHFVFDSISHLYITHLWFYLPSSIKKIYFLIIISNNFFKKNEIYLILLHFFVK